MKQNKDFWKYFQNIVDTHEIIIDRPKGSHHPKYPDMIYKWNYGYIKDTQSMDGGGIDVFMGTLHNRIVNTLLCNIDIVKNDSEIKVLLGCTGRQIKEILEFMNDSEYMKAIVISKEIDLSDEEIREYDYGYHFEDLYTIFQDIVCSPTKEKVKHMLMEYKNDDDKTLYGAYSKTKLTGIIGVKKHKQYIEVMHFGVHPDYRTKGIGTKLMDYIKESNDVIKADTDDDAIDFYEKYGFKYKEYKDEKWEVKRYKCEYGK